MFKGNDGGSTITALTLDMSEGGNATFAGNILFDGSGVISTNTSDGSDNAQLSLAGGGADSDGRGARIRLYGNEHASLAGVADLSTGNIAGSHMYLTATDSMILNTGGSESMRIDSSGNLLLGAGTGNPYLAFLSAGGNGGNERARIFGYADGGTYGGGLEIQTRDSLNVFQNRINIDSSGTITTNTTAELMLSLNTTAANGGYLRFRESDTTKFFIGARGAVSGGTGTGYDIYTAAGNDLRLWTAGSTALTIDTSQNATFAGNVAIGYAAQSNIRTFVYDNSSNYSLVVQQDGSGVPLQVSSAGSIRMLVANNGNIGIGTDSPDITGFGYTTLTVVGGTSAGYAGVLELGSPTTNANGQNLGIIAFMDGSTRNAQIDVTRESSTSTSNMHFYTNGGSGIEERMRITSGGDFLVRQTSSEVFDTNTGVSVAQFWGNQLSSSHNNASKVIMGTATNIALVGGATNNSAGKFIVNSYMRFESTSQTAGSEAGNISFYTTNGGQAAASRLVITSAGYLKSPETYNLTTATAANMHVDSNGFFYRSTSSLKYKTDVKDYDKGLNEVMQLQPKYYKGKNDGDTQFAGLIAEDVNDLGLSEFVQYAADGTPDALAYTHMVALLVGAIQELKAEIELLKNK